MKKIIVIMIAAIAVIIAGCSYSHYPHSSKSFKPDKKYNRVTRCRTYDDTHKNYKLR